MGSDGTGEQGSSMEDRLRGALWGMFIGDALAMPAHKYTATSYRSQFRGKMTHYVAPNIHHPDSKMYLLNTGSAGKGSQQSNVVGGFIMRGKKKLWSIPNMHYHQGLKAGQNTLNLEVCKRLMETLIKCKRYDRHSLVKEYITYLRGCHQTDTYCEGFHREFFTKYYKGAHMMSCASPASYSTVTAGLVTLALPIIIFLFLYPEQVITQTCVDFCRCFVNEGPHEKYFEHVIRLVVKVLQGECVEKIGLEIANTLDTDIQELVDETAAYRDNTVVGGVFSSGSDIDAFLLSSIFLTIKYRQSFKSALQNNTACGGENCMRGALIGLVSGANVGTQGIPDQWIKNIHGYSTLSTLIEDFIQIIVSNKTGLAG